jgi:hypothetical protein
MKKKSSILRAIDLAEQRFFEDTLRNPDLIIVSPVGYALMLEEVGNEFMEEDYRYNDKFIAVCSHPSFDVFKLAVSEE